MGSLFVFWVVLFGLAIYILKPKWLIFYWISIYPVLVPLFCLFTLVIDRDVFHEIVDSAFDAGRNLFFILILIEYAKKQRFPKLGRILYAFVAIIFFLFIQAIIVHPDVISLWPMMSELLSLLLPLVFFIQRKDLLPTSQSIYIFTAIIIFVEFLATILEVNGIHLYLTLYVPYQYLLGNGDLTWGEEGLVRGTFPLTSLFANFLVTIYLFITLEYFSNKSISRFHFSLFTLCILVMILSSGIRSCLLLFAFILFGCCCLFIKRNKYLFFIILFVSILGFLFINNFDPEIAGDLSGNEGINRQISGLSLYSKAEDSNEIGTLGLSIYLIDNYFFNSPFIGNGLANLGEYAYGNLGSVTLTNFKADSRWAFTLVEYGLLGTFLYYLFFFSIIYFLSRKVNVKERKKVFFCFIFYFLLTIVDPGFFDRLNFPLLYLYSLSVLEQNYNAKCILKAQLV